MSLSSEEGEVRGSAIELGQGHVKDWSSLLLFSRCCSPAEHAPLTLLPSYSLKNIIYLYVVVG